jgi:hypothetical protein
VSAALEHAAHAIACERIDVVLARERAELVEPTLAAIDVEARVRARVRIGAAGFEAAWRSGGVHSLHEAREAWPTVHFPRVLDELAALSGGVRPTVALTADQLAWFARRAPTTFARLAREVDVVLRDPCFVAAANEHEATFTWRPSGPVRIEPRAAPLFATAHGLARGRIGEHAADRDAVELVRAVLLAVHTHGRLPPRIEWVASEGALRQRGASFAASGPRVFLRSGSELAFAPQPGAAALAIDVAPPIDTPRAVVAAVVAWLCGDRVARVGSLFVDPTGTHVRSVE